MYRWTRLEPSASTNAAARNKAAEMVSMEEHLMLVHQMRQEHDAEVSRLRADFAMRTAQLEDSIAALNKDLVLLKSRPTPEPPPYVPPPSPYASSAPPPPPPPPPDRKSVV